MSPGLFNPRPRSPSQLRFAGSVLEAEGDGWADFSASR